MKFFLKRSEKSMIDQSSAECYTVLSPYLGHIKCDIPLESELKVNSSFMFYVQNDPKL